MTTRTVRVDPASFRDPAGQVLESDDGRIFRIVRPQARDDFQAAHASTRVAELIESGALIAAQESPADVPAEWTPPESLLIEHPRVPFLSYPAEWPFSALKAAALLHLDLQLKLLDDDLTLSDASAFNIQFIGPHPIFIDWLSLRRYREGEYWAGHAQFCDEFLNPLLLSALRGVPHHAWLRSLQDGIPRNELARLLPWRAYLSPRIWTHVLLPLYLERRVRSRRKLETQAHRRPLPRKAYRGLLLQLRHWIQTLNPPALSTPWGRYTSDTSYSASDAQAKKAAVEAFVGARRPEQLWDLGCAGGEFSEAALQAGAKTVIGFDADCGALEQAFTRTQKQRLHLLPLYQDFTNPTPAQGWQHQERRSLQDRSRQADALLALALTHHLAISRNLPLEQIAAWLTGLAPCGLVEFVPRGDSRVDDLLALRDREFPEYTPENFEQAMAKHAHLQPATEATTTGRRLYIFERK